MPRFFVSTEQIDDERITLAGDDAHHVARSLRAAVGDLITVCDTNAVEYECKICGFEEDKKVFLSIESRHVCETEPPMQITLFQALCKGDKLDTVIQKSVECGVCKIVPFESERCVVRSKEESEDRKTERRKKIAIEAAKQSGRGVLPDVLPTVDFSKMLAMAAESEVVLFCYEGLGTQPIGNILAKSLAAKNDGKYPSVAVIVGSEGGFSPEEARKANEAGFFLTGLGRRILRTETAPIFAVACIICVSELS